MNAAVYLLLGAWRSWLGGGIGKDWPTRHGIAWVQYLALAAVPFGASWPDWHLALTNYIGVLLLARGYGHGPMLSLPIGPDPDGDWIYDYIARWVPNLEARWWVYSLVRYVGFSGPWAAALAVQGYQWAGPVAGALLIVITFRALWPIRAKLPTLNDVGNQAQNWTEIIGWTLLGAALVLVEPIAALVRHVPF